MKTQPFEDLFNDLAPAVKKQARVRFNQLRRDMILRELRKSLKLTQAQVSRETGIKASNLSRLERQSDMRIATLRKIVSAMGGKLEIIARFKDRNVRITMPRCA